MKFNILIYIFKSPDITIAGAVHEAGDVDHTPGDERDFFLGDDDDDEDDAANPTMMGTGSTTGLMMSELKCFSSFNRGVVFMSTFIIDLSLV